MDRQKNQTFAEDLIRQIIELALVEDRARDDVTTNSLLDYDREVTARVTAKEDGIISGIQVFSAAFQTLDPGIKIKVFKEDGVPVKKGDIVLELIGMESSILKAERTALNFLQRLSGIATLTRRYVEKLGALNITLLDTRKTTPGMRYLEKKAVQHGGGTNHRMNLADMAMVKDNHIKMAGSISHAVKKIREKYPDKKIEVEVKNLEELEETLSLLPGVHMIMLDNFSPGLINEAVKRNNQQVKLEISGNVNLDNIAAKAVEGIDYISVGALTHSFKSLDLSLNIEELK
ncbi:MAG: carboxylating nicotinate-nucleotide diphosphorylase [Candidatus Aminicenantes bacterium]|nr:carboxylating nicotinate-nucleotide diphosphorylase [Candidatus Aminicenantes bacterium]NIM83591.1 carboxylating nicotinate-nucleotide diphosphorylase [Candidatus Aminicenantes bacterium]NIN22995.1 carboxylating nicotinate-nucleotide diphosphorylase [Candidatus Aminicenantes bacterium]NIN46732.1 carboxylating nicotinate-nucleotide diphosphorylase [Candidatus Aminicenantes bacterium]NIN89638.1 carboxylating nicotinate-nucleotide diphosphorylase [Candidatus Aminicenantes bacterium]